MYLCLYVSVALSLNHCLGVQVSVHVIPDCYYHDTVSLIVVGDVAAGVADDVGSWCGDSGGDSAPLNRMVA